MTPQTRAIAAFRVSCFVFPAFRVTPVHSALPYSTFHLPTVAAEHLVTSVCYPARPPLLVRALLQVTVVVD